MARKKQAVLYVAPERVGRSRKIGSPEEMHALWEEYRADCDSHMKPQSVIGRDGRVTNVLIAAPLTHTITGFCLYIGLTESSFDRTYRNDEDYADLIELIEMDTEIDARSKFEDGSLNAKLAPLWMGRHKGYSVKQETDIRGGVPVVISGESDLED